MGRSSLTIVNLLLIFIAVLAYRGIGSRVSLLKPKIRNHLARTNIQLNAQESTIIVAQNIDIPKKLLSPIELCLCGACATAFGVFVMHPIDTIKITQQTAAVTGGMLQTAKQIVAKHGPAGLYQGVVPYLIGDAIGGALKFGSFEMLIRFVNKHIPKKYHGVARFASAAIAMVAASITLVPAEMLKTRLQAGVITSMQSALRNILHREGIRGLYVGYAATLLRDVPYTMLELGLYENIKQVMESMKPIIVNVDGTITSEPLSTRDELFAAAITGGITAFLTTPLDLIKTKLMMQTAGGGRYSGVLHALQSIFQEGGLPALFVGSMARVAWLLPFTMIYLGTYEHIKRTLLARKNPQQHPPSATDNP